LIFIWLISAYSTGQSCDTINGRIMNCTDSLGLKQGYWELRNKVVLGHGYSGYGSKGGCQYYEHAEYYLRANGAYLNSKEIGSWGYYSGDHGERLEKEITYWLNGSKLERNYYPNYSIKINSDSNLIQGQYFHHFDTIKIKCENNRCAFQLSFNKEITNFGFEKFEDLEFELFQLAFGHYEKSIRRLIAERQKY